MNSISSSDNFTLFTLRVEIDQLSKNIIGNHSIGDYFEVIGEDIFLPHGQGFSLYALASLLPLLSAKQRQNSRNDFMETDDLVADPDVNSGAVYRIIRTGEKTFRHRDVSGNSIFTPSNHD